MNTTYNEVINGVPTNLVVPRGGVYRGQRLGKKSSDETYASFNLYPIVNNPIQPTATQDYGEQIKTFDAVLKVVNVTNTVVDRPLEQLQAEKERLVESAVQSMLDESSRSRGYDNIISECSYATSTGAFGAEAQITVNWRDAVWSYVFKVQADVLAGTRTEPTLEALLAELPARV